MKKAGKTRWYLEPLDTTTNENAVMDLVRKCGASEDDIHYGKRDNQGRTHDVLQVEYAFVVRMERSIPNLNHMFRVYTQRDGERTMKLWPFGGRGKLARTKEVKRVAQELKKIKTAKKVA